MLLSRARVVSLVVPLAALALVLGAPRADARCAMQGLGVEVLTPLDRPLPRGSAVLIGLRRSSDRAIATLPASVTIAARGRPGVTVAIETLAPGLARIPLGGAIQSGPIEIRGATPTPISLTITSAPLPAPLQAPRVSSIAVNDGGRRGTSVQAMLSAPAPADAIAVIVSAGAEAITFSVPTPGTALELVSYGRCVPWPTGARAPRDGDAIVLRYVDRTGQLSAPSAPVVARGAR